MSSISFLRKAGLFLREDVLDAALCARLSAEMADAPGESPSLYRDGEYAIDHGLRRSLRLRMPAASRTLVQQTIDALRPAVAEHFHLTLHGTEGADFLAYRTGDFFAVHRDRARADDHLPAGPRQVALIIFLNPSPGYVGGDLRLYSVLDDPQFKEYGFSVPPAPGLLVAFRADLLHEVTPVVSGARFVIVDRFR